MADLTYSCTDGIWTRFFPNTSAGTDAWRVMAAADPDGVVAFSQTQVPGVLRQIKAAGLTVRKASPKTLTGPEIDAMLAELDALPKPNQGGELMATAKPLDIELTSAEAAMIRNVFFPANPRKMRTAAPEVVDLATRMIAALEKRAHGPGSEWDGPQAGRPPAGR